MRWRLTNHADPRGVRLADRHYSRKTIGAPQFTPPGRKLVLITPEANALWVTSYPFAEYVKHAWAGAWMCSLFRNESPHLSSELILEAVAATKWKYADDIPALGMITFVEPKKVRSTNPGFCYLKAGFNKVGYTKGGQLALQLLPEEMPPAEPPLGAWEQSRLSL